MTLTLLRRLALFSGRRYGPIFWVLGAVVVLSLALAARLRFDTDVLGLLPQRAPEVKVFRASLEEFGSLDYLLVALRIPPGADLFPYESFAGELGDELHGLEGVDRVEYRLGEIEEMVASFLPRAILFLDEEGRRELVDRLGEERLRGRARELKRLLSTPQSVALKELIRLDPLDLAPIFIDQVAGTRGGLSVDWTSGYLLSRDHEMLLLLVRPTRSPQDVEFGKELVTAVNDKVAAVRGRWAELGGDPARPPVVELGGRYVIALGDEALIRRDVVINVITATAGVLVLFLFAFRRFGPLIYAVVPLATGLALTFGFSGAVFGVMSSATSGVAALLIGLGIDFVIVSYGRFVEERQGGAGLEEALGAMSGSSGRAVVVGAVTSAATFYAFGVTDFPGLSQMGYLTGTGILLCMLAVLLLLPAMLAWSEHHHRRRDRGPRLFLHGFGSGRLIRICYARPRTTLAVALVLTAVAGLSALRLRFDDTMQSMRPAGNRGIEVRDEVARRFGSGFDHMMLVLWGDSLEEVLALAERAAEGASRLVDEEVLSGYDGAMSIIPPPARQAEVLAWLSERSGGALDANRVRAVFAEALAAEGLRPEAFAGGLDLLEAALARTAPLTLEELRETEQTARLADRYLRQDEEGWKSVVYLYSPPGMWRRGPPSGAVRLAADLGPGTALTGQNVVSKFLRKRVLQEAALATAVGFLAVGILLWLDYRRLRETLLTLAPLSVGILWMLGAMAALGIAMNFMNIFVSTMIIGIGVDYGIHIIHRYRELGGAGGEHLEEGLVETGKAIMLAALSTMVGFGSLSLSHYPGLRSMGLVAILGAISACLVAISVLPAWAALRLETQRRAAADGGHADGC